MKSIRFGISKLFGMGIRSLLIVFLPFIFTESFANYQWVQEPSLPITGIERASGFSIRDDIYFGTGYMDPNNFGSITDAFWKYNTINGTWSQIASLQGARHGAVGFSHADKGYIISGHRHSTSTFFSDVQEYNPLTNTWAYKASMTMPSRYGSACFKVNGKAYLVTGNFGSATGPFTNQNLEYDIANNTWTMRNPYPGGSLYYATAFGIGDYGYVGTGLKKVGNVYTYYDNFYRYDPANDQWTAITGYPGGPVAGASAVVFQNKAFVGCGSSSSNTFGTFYIYDPATGNWAQGPGLPPGFQRAHGVTMATDSLAFIGTGLYQNASRNDLWKLDELTSLEENTIDDLYQILFQNGVISVKSSVEFSGTIELIDAAGKMILKSNDSVLNVGEKVSAGLYFVRVIDKRLNVAVRKVYISR